jgi:hypothetical protein
MKLSAQGNFSDESNYIPNSASKDKLRDRLKYIVLQYLQDNPDDIPIFGLPQQVDQVYNSDMYLQESINILNSLSEVFNLIDEHYQILNESDN